MWLLLPFTTGCQVGRAADSPSLSGTAHPASKILEHQLVAALAPQLLAYRPLTAQSVLVLTFDHQGKMLQDTCLPPWGPQPSTRIGLLPWQQRHHCCCSPGLSTCTGKVRALPCPRCSSWHMRHCLLPLSPGCKALREVAAAGREDGSFRNCGARQSWQVSDPQHAQL